MENDFFMKKMSKFYTLFIYTFTAYNTFTVYNTFTAYAKHFLPFMYVLVKPKKCKKPDKKLSNRK